MSPITFKGANTVYAKDQPEYRQLPAYNNGIESVSCWKLTWRELLKLILTRRLWLLQKHFGAPLQPQLPSIDPLIEYN